MINIFKTKEDKLAVKIEMLITDEQVKEWTSDWRIQEYFNRLVKNEMEYLLSGYVQKSLDKEAVVKIADDYLKAVDIKELMQNELKERLINAVRKY